MNEQTFNITYTLGNLGDSSTSKILWVIKKIAKDRNVPLGTVAQPLRVALTGGTKSPPIDVVWDILGEERCLKRINDVLSECHGRSKIVMELNNEHSTV